MSLSETTITKLAGVVADSEVASAVSARANIIEMTQDAEDAVLRPKDIGAFGHDLRAAIAARVANLAGDGMLAAYYLADAGQYAALSDPNTPGAAQGQEAVLALVDKVANQTSDVTALDIQILQVAKISDPDIVRLCELVAFLAFQIRVIAGLRLMQSEAA
ncbi:hypothetical protein [Ruegeria hyattellae]|uniref:hypothetical protein n=1 Tax=Ruegeria hyattellae TaxID=3233337 RepID=UPI00355BAB70